MTVIVMLLLILTRTSNVSSQYPPGGISCITFLDTFIFCVFTRSSIQQYRNASYLVFLFWINTLLLMYIRGTAALYFKVFSFWNNNYSMFLSKLLPSLMSNYFPKRSSGAPLCTLSKLYHFHIAFVAIPHLRLCIALIATAEGWLLLNIG